MAFRNLQRSDLPQELALITIPEGSEVVHSDVSGNPSKSSHGVPKSKSANNSEDDSDMEDSQRIKRPQRKA